MGLVDNAEQISLKGKLEVLRKSGWPFSDKYEGIDLGNLPGSDLIAIDEAYNGVLKSAQKARDEQNRPAYDAAVAEQNTPVPTEDTAAGSGNIPTGEAERGTPPADLPPVTPPITGETDETGSTVTDSSTPANSGSSEELNGNG